MFEVNSILTGGLLVVGGVLIGSTFSKKKAEDLGHTVAQVIPGHVVEPHIADIAMSFAKAVNDDKQPEISNSVTGFSKFAQKHLDIDEKGKIKIK